MSGEDYSRISIGGLSIGIIGLKAAIEAVKPLRGRGDDHIAQTLLERLSKSNYIPASAEEGYKRAFLREFKKALGEKVSEERDALSIKILGPGCPSCHSMEQMNMALLTEMKLGADVEHVTERKEIAALGVFATPGLVINDEVKAAGRPPTRATLRQWLTQAAGRRKA